MKSISILFHRFYLTTRFISGFGGLSCYLMSWLLAVDILKKDAVSGCGCVTYFTVVANFLSIAFDICEARYTPL